MVLDQQSEDEPTRLISSVTACFYKRSSSEKFASWTAFLVARDELLQISELCPIDHQAAAVALSEEV